MFMHLFDKLFMKIGDPFESNKRLLELHIDRPPADLELLDKDLINRFSKKVQSVRILSVCNLSNVRNPETRKTLGQMIMWILSGKKSTPWTIKLVNLGIGTELANDILQTLLEKRMMKKQLDKECNSIRELSLHENPDFWNP